MKAAWAIVKQQYPTVTMLGCCAHALNLLLSDMAKVMTLQEGIKKVTWVIKYMKHSCVVCAHSAKKQLECCGGNKTTLKQPAEMCWAGIIMSLESLLKNKKFCKRL